MMGLLSLLLLVLQNPTPQSCTWRMATEVGTLNPVVNESSGMAISRKIPNRAYRHNDSGDTGRFFVMDLDGRNMKAVRIAGFAPLDVEDMAVGPCAAASDCLFFGDIGDNSNRRGSVELVIVRERSSFPAEVRADYRVTLRYPGGPHDAEALAVHPDGTVYILTKHASSPQLFRLKRQQWHDAKGPQMLEPIATLDWAAVLPDSLSLGRLATGMDIAPDGKRFLVLTYVEAVEFRMDLSRPLPDPRTWKDGRHYRRIPITMLEQEEAIAYLPDGKAFLYDTERRNASRSARIMRVGCVN